MRGSKGIGANVMNGADQSLPDFLSYTGAILDTSRSSMLHAHLD